ncbi:MAG: hypothetical protein JWP48_117 [Actinoallomurus sp.]|jgi:hypothetical protein|nr:hypothetical protein [Actinoallomurus sp.]
MKFEIVEQSRGGPLADHYADIENPLTETQASDDPIQGLRAGTSRLLTGVRAEAQQISECVAEVADLAAVSARAQIMRHDRGLPARPPASFRAARFGGATEIEPPVAGDAGHAWPTGTGTEP